MKKMLFTKVLSAVITASCLGILFFAKLDSSACEDSLYLDNVGVTDCWKGTCGHKAQYVSYPAYVTKKTYTTYYYTQVYANPKVSTTISTSKSVSNSINFSGTVGKDVAKASVGYTCGDNSTYTISQTITNTGSTKKYVHIGVDFVERGNTITVKDRTYNPTWHVTAVDKYCEYSQSYCGVSSTMSVGAGISLLSYIINS